MEEFNVYEGILEGLQEAVAYKQGDRTRCRVSVRKIPVSEYKAADVARTRKDRTVEKRDSRTMKERTP